MSVGRFGDDDEPGAAFADRLESGEEVHLSWDASDVRWANQWTSAPDATTFAATDRRVLFDAGDGPVSIGYNHVRAVKTDPADGVDLSVAFVACGGLCLVVGMLAATRDFANGVGLVALSVLLLITGSAVSGEADGATVTIVIDNERQRLSFTADEAVGEELAHLSERRRTAGGRSVSAAADELPTPTE
jgi:hypothetical protein